MTDTIFNKADYFNNVPEHLQKQYNKMVTKAFKKEIRNGPEIRIEKYPLRRVD